MIARFLAVDESGNQRLLGEYTFPHDSRSARMGVALKGGRASI